MKKDRITRQPHPRDKRNESLRRAGKLRKRVFRCAEELYADRIALEILDLKFYERNHRLRPYGQYTYDVFAPDKGMARMAERQEVREALQEYYGEQADDTLEENGS